MYVTALPEKDFDDAISELNALGENSGGKAIGYEGAPSPARLDLNFH